MRSNFLLYGSTGFTGSLMARLAVQRGLHPILATRLTLAVTTSQPSRGTTRTLTYVIFPCGCKVWRNGQLETLAPGSKTRMIDFGNGPCETLLAPWDDGLTAYYSTGIPNIEDYNWTLITALDAAQKVLVGGVPAGFQTPGQAFGADFVLQCPQVTRRDVE